MTLDAMLALPSGEQLSREQLLGTVTFFSVPDAGVESDRLMQLWQAEGLDATLLPPSRKPSHIFQAACRSVESRRTGDKDAEVKVDEVLDTTAECVYQITRLLRDRTNRVIDHPPAMRVVFTKATEDIDFDPLKPEHYDALKGLTELVRKHYEANVGCVPGQKLRNALRDYIDRLAGQVLRRGGGVYFVPIEGADTLESIERVLLELYGQDAQLHMIPLAKNEKAQDMVKEHHIANVQQEIEEQVGELAQLLKRGSGVRSDKLANLIQRRRAITKNHKRYQDLLDDQLGELRVAMETYDEQLEKLMEAVV